MIKRIIIIIIAKKKVKQKVSFEFNSVHCKHFYDYFLFLLLK